MAVSFSKLNQLGFTPSHEIYLDAGEMPRFAKLKKQPGATSPAVYIWLLHAKNAAEGKVLYVGKAGKGVSRRCVQHQGGFASGKGAGGKNAKALRKALHDPTMSVTVLGRNSETIKIFEKTVSMYATEEDAFCALFEPSLNRAAFPDVAIASEGSHGSLHSSDNADQPLKDDIGFSTIGLLVNSRLRVQDQGTVDDMLAQIEAYAPNELVILERLLTLIDSRLLDADHAMKLVRGYTEQPVKCDGVTTLGFGRIVNSNFAPKGWVARVYLTDKVRVSFPLDIKKPNLSGRIEENRTLFSPIDIDEFLDDPESFLLLSNNS